MSVCADIVMTTVNWMRMDMYLSVLSESTEVCRPPSNCNSAQGMVNAQDGPWSHWISIMKCYYSLEKVVCSQKCGEGEL